MAISRSTPPQSNDSDWLSEIDNLMREFKYSGKVERINEAKQAIRQRIAQQCQWFDDRFTDEINQENQDWGQVGDDFTNRIAELRAEAGKAAES